MTFCKVRYHPRAFIFFLDLWQEAIKYIDQVFQFSIGLVLAYFLGQYLENQLEIPYLQMIVMTLLGSFLFWRFMRGLNKLNES